MLLTTLSAMVFVPNDRLLLEVGAFLAGLVADAQRAAKAVCMRWMGLRVGVARYWAAGILLWRAASGQPSSTATE